MKKPFFIFMILFFKPWVLNLAVRDRLVIWNVGQGSWATFISESYCAHFDMGGEKRPWPKELRRCLERENYLFLSHLDYDHISQISQWQFQARHFCLAATPRDLVLKNTQAWKKSLISSLTICPSHSLNKLGVNEISFTPSSRDANSLSRVYQFREFLFPGDSNKSAEKKWSPHLTSQIRILILGHHGSRTSTSDLLLHHLPFLKGAIASARYQKYGHPHREVIHRLQKRKTPLLTTEKWGHLIFEL